MKNKEINLGYINIESWKLGDHTKEIDVKEIILEPKKKYTLKITYPLSKSFETSFKTGKNGMTREAFIELVCKSYHYIYNKENKTSKIKEDLIPGMYNRIQTNGDYGIWGHLLGDLILHTLYFEEDNIIILGIDS